MRDKKETKTLPAKKDACQKRKNLKLQKGCMKRIRKKFMAPGSGVHQTLGWGQYGNIVEMY